MSKGRKRVEKGKAFERAVARALRKLDPRARRCLQYQRQHGAPDVAAGRLWVECKARRVPVGSVYEATAQRVREVLPGVEPGMVPVVVSKTKARGSVVVTLALSDFVQLVAEPRTRRKAR